MDYSDVCCIIIFIILVIIWIARQISKSKKEKESRVGHTYKPYEKITYGRKEPIATPEYIYKLPYQPPQAAYKPPYIQPKPGKTVCKRCNSDDLKYFESGYVKCNKCGYYYYDGSRRIEHKG
jgi:hypothetical protein